MPDPKLGASVLYTETKNDPPQHAVITAVGVDDDREEYDGKVTDCWLHVFPAGGPARGLTEPVPYDADGKSGTWRWPDQDDDQDDDVQPEDQGQDVDTTPPAAPDAPRTARAPRKGASA